MIFLTCVILSKIIKVLCTGFITKTRALLLAAFSFVLYINKIDHNFGAPAAGRFHSFIHYGGFCGVNTLYSFWKISSFTFKMMLVSEKLNKSIK